MLGNMDTAAPQCRDVLHPRTAAFPTAGTTNHVLVTVLTRLRKLSLKAKIIGKSFFFSYFFPFSEMNFAVSQPFSLLHNRRG